jgi:acetyl esterase/lipase
VAAEYWYLLSAALVGLLAFVLVLAVKKFNLLGIRPDQKIVYRADGAQPLTLHVFKARNRVDDSLTPAILLFHGGRWLHGDPEQFYPQCQFFAAHGFTCISAEYRLSAKPPPDVRGALADAQSALRYLMDNAVALDVDPKKITVGGGSAGGHLAAALGAGLPLAHNLASLSAARRPAAQVLYNPTLDLAPGTPDHSLVKDYWHQVSPYHHIDSAVPPTLILLGSKDTEVPLSTAQAFCHALQKVGARCDIELYEGQGHGFFNKPPYREQTNQRILAFLQRLQQ